MLDIRVSEIGFLNLCPNMYVLSCNQCISYSIFQVSIWLQLNKVEGVHSILDTIGAHSMHNQGQFHFEVVGGAVRWFHRNETGDEVFSVITGKSAGMFLLGSFFICLYI